MNLDPAVASPEYRRLLQEAAEWRLIGLLFECPDEAWAAQVTSLAPEIADPLLAAAVDVAHQEAAPGLYHTLFGPGGPAAPREVSHHPDVLPGASLAELRDFYQAFAYQPALDEPPDHVAVEAGFVAYLRFKQAYAVARGDEDQARICVKAERHVITEHLSKLAGPLAAALASSGVAYLAHAAAALHARVDAIKN